MLQGVENGVVDGRRHQQRADRHVTARERLCHSQEVRLEAPMVERKQAAGATEAGLNLVDAEERPVATAELLRAFQVTVRWKLRPMPLNGLDDEDRNVLAAKRSLERVQIVKRDPQEPGQQRLEALAEHRVAGGRQRAERQPVEAMLAGDDLRSTRRRAAELQRRLDRLGTRAREEHTPE